LSRQFTLRVMACNMTIHLNPEQEHRIAEALRSGAYSSTDDVIDRAPEVLHEQDEWLTANRQAIDDKIRTGIAERGLWPQP